MIIAHEHQSPAGEEMAFRATQRPAVRHNRSADPIYAARQPIINLDGRHGRQPHTPLVPELRAAPGATHVGRASSLEGQVMRKAAGGGHCACGGMTEEVGGCASCQAKQSVLRRSAAGGEHGPRTIPPVVHEALGSPGQPLDPAVRAFMEPRFGQDFGHVRVHTDAKAAESARAINALAYTVGPHIVLGPGQYAPGTVEGKRLLAHELAHTVQQRGGVKRSAGRLEVSRPTDACEREADAAADALTQERPFAVGQNRPHGIARQGGTAGGTGGATAGSPACIPGAGLTNSTCSAYSANSWWLPLAYVNNATCACLATPNSPTANCVRKVLQDRLAATPASIKRFAASQKPLETGVTYPIYQGFVQRYLTPLIYTDHVIAYRTCCCPSGPAPYPSWIGVTTAPIQPCSVVGFFIRYFGSCHGTPGAW